MELSDKIKAFLPAVVVVGALTESPSVQADEPKKPQITEQQKKELEKYKYELEDGRFFRGKLSKLNPTNASADASSDYYKTFDEVREFLAKYDRETLPDEYKNLQKECIDALLRNLLVPNLTVVSAGFRTGDTSKVVAKGLNDEIREVLRQEGVLDYEQQLEQLVSAGQNALKKAGQIATLTKPEEYKKVKDDVEHLHQYVKLLHEQAQDTIRLALTTRLQPRIPPDIYTEISKIVDDNQEVFNHLVEFEQAVHDKDTKKIREQLKEYKNRQKNVFDGLNGLVQKSGEQVEVELDIAWESIAVRPDDQPYLDKSDKATVQFAKKWGRLGENFYRHLDKFGDSEKGLLAGFEHLKRYVNEKLVQIEKAQADNQQKYDTAVTSENGKYPPLTEQQLDELADKILTLSVQDKGWLNQRKVKALGYKDQWGNSPTYIRTYTYYGHERTIGIRIFGNPTVEFEWSLSQFPSEIQIWSPGPDGNHGKGNDDILLRKVPCKLPPPELEVVNKAIERKR